jgi:hypothetical protein
MGLVRALQVVVGMHVAVVLAQAAFAGQMLSGNAWGAGLHALNGWVVIFLVGLTQLVLAILVRWSGRGPVWPAAASALLWGTEMVQMWAGSTRNLALHVPLAMAIFGWIVVVLVSMRRLGRG